jgi:hypothetical protein
MPIMVTAVPIDFLQTRHFTDKTTLVSRIATGIIMAIEMTEKVDNTG